MRHKQLFGGEDMKAKSKNVKAGSRGPLVNTVLFY